MTQTYWITFCIADSGSEERRYHTLLETVRRLTSDIWWTESVNFLLFRSEHGIDDIAAEVARALDAETDLALLAKASAEEARAIGAVADALLFELTPYAQRFRFDPLQAPAAPGA